MEKFISERLHPVPFTLGGRKKDEEATEQERSYARASIGASTLTAETQSPAKGLQEAGVEHHSAQLDLREWEKAASQRRLTAIDRENIDETLQKGLCFFDAKSQLDHLVKSTVGSTEDRRTAIEMQLVRQSMQGAEMDQPRANDRGLLDQEVREQRISKQIPQEWSLEFYPA